MKKIANLIKKGKILQLSNKRFTDSSHIVVVAVDKHNILM